MEPLAAIPLHYSNAADSVSPRLRLWLGVQSIMLWLSCAFAWILIATWDVKSVIVSGPGIFILALMLLLLALRARATAYLILAAAHGAICLLFFALVWRLRWSPEEAKLPFEIMGGIYLAIIGLVTIWAWFARSVTAPKLPTGGATA